METARIGDYELKNELGRGGMATVFLAYDKRFNRDVAIKWLAQEHSTDTEFVARFLQEAKLVAALEFPAIVPIYDVGEHHGRPYYVMRFLSGGSLEQRALGRLSARQIVNLLQPIALALHRAHDRNVIHRDVKPANILIDREDNPYLSDFGIAKHLVTGAGLTQQGWIGTPEYMSPEQARGQPATRQSDVYALGVTLFQALTGRVPFSGGAAIDVLNRHLDEAVPSIASTPSALSRAADEIVGRAMAKDPRRRYATAREMAEALEALPPTDTGGASTAPSRTPTPSRMPTSSPTPAPTRVSAVEPQALPRANPTFATKNREFCVGRTNDLIVLVHPLDWHFDTYREMTAGFADLAGPRPHKAVLVHGAGRPPTAAERQHVVQATPRCLRTAVLTRHPMMRFMMTAMAWMLGSGSEEKIRGFAPDNHRAAIAWLQEVADFDPAEAVALLRRLVIWSGQTTSALDGKP